MQSSHQLRSKLKQFRTLLKSGLYERIEEQVLNDLAQHDTATYIQRLEATVKKLQASLRDEAIKHRELRVAHTAQQRAFDKCVHHPPSPLCICLGFVFVCLVFGATKRPRYWCSHPNLVWSLVQPLQAQDEGDAVSTRRSPS